MEVIVYLLMLIFVESAATRVDMKAVLAHHIGKTHDRDEHVAHCMTVLRDWYMLAHLSAELLGARYIASTLQCATFLLSCLTVGQDLIAVTR